MILARSTTYWSTGVSLRWREITRDGVTRSAWGGSVDYLDDGFAGDDDADTGKVSTEGELRTRYLVTDGKVASGLRAVVDVLLADAARLGIEFRGTLEGRPYLMFETEDGAPDGWRELLIAEAERIGWTTMYKRAAAGDPASA